MHRTSSSSSSSARNSSRCGVKCALVVLVVAFLAVAAVFVRGDVKRLSAAAGAAGETQFYAACATPDGKDVVYGTQTSPARLVAYKVNTNMRIRGVELAAGLNQASSCIVSRDGATLIASMFVSPAKFVKHNVADLLQAASSLTLNSGEDKGTFGASDSTFCFFALRTMPAKCAKIQWSGNTRVAVIGMNGGENKGYGLDIDTRTNELVMSTGTTPAYVIKLSTSPTFARTSSLKLNTGENLGFCVTIADAFSFISCLVSPGIVVKVKNSDMSRVGAVTLSANANLASGSVADWQFLYVVTQTDPASVVQLRLSDLNEVSVLQLQEGSGVVAALPGGNRSAGVAFFSMHKSGQLGLSVKVQLDARGAVAPKLLKRLSASSADAGEKEFHAVCASSSTVVYGTATKPPRIVTYSASSNARLRSITLDSGFDEANGCVVSHDGADFVMSFLTTPAKFVKRVVADLSLPTPPSNSNITLPTGRNRPGRGVLDRAGEFVYFALAGSPPKCAKLLWRHLSSVADLFLDTTDKSHGVGLAMDDATGDLIMSTEVAPAHVIKIRTVGGFNRIAGLTLASGEDTSRDVVCVSGFAYVPLNVDPGIVVKVKISDMSRAATLQLSVGKASGVIADWQFLYVVTQTEPASVVQVSLSDFTVASALQLQEGKGIMGALPGGNRSAGVAFFSMHKSGQLGLSVKVQLDASGAVAPRMQRLSVAVGGVGETGFHAVCATPTRAIFGTYASPARLVAYSVAGNSRIEGVSLAAGINSAIGCIISHDGATLIVSMATSPAKFVQHSVVGLAQAATPLTLNTGEDKSVFGAQDSTSAFVFFALMTTPAKCAKIQWSDNTRVAVIDMSAGENSGYGLDIDTATSDLIMSTNTKPVYAVKLSTTPTFARTSSVQLNSGENSGMFMTICDGFSFILCDVSPGIVVKIKNSDMTRVAAVTLSVNQPYGSVADYKFLYVVTRTDPASVVQLRVSDLTEVGVLQLQEGQGRGAALPGDNRSAGVAFFSMYKENQLGLSVKVQLDASGAVAPSMLRVSVASAAAGEVQFFAVCASPDGKDVVYGTYTKPARLVAYHVSNNSRIRGVQLAWGIEQAIDCIISADGATLIAVMYTSPAKFVKHTVADLSQAASPLTLNSGENLCAFGKRDAASAFAYFAMYGTSAKCAKLRWSDNARVAVIDMRFGEINGYGLDIDAGTSDLIMSTQTSPAYAIKISTSPTFARTSSLQLNAGENIGVYVTIADGSSFVSCKVSPGIIVKVKNSDLTRVGAVTLFVDSPRGSVVDWKFLYVVTATDSATVVQVRLSDLAEVSVLQLQEGSGRGAAMPGRDRSAGVAFFSMFKTGQLGLSVKVQLDASGAVDANPPTTTTTAAPTTTSALARLSAAAGAAGETGFHAVCATPTRVVYGTYTSPARLIVYSVADNARIDGVELAAGMNYTHGCVISRDGATLIASMTTDPAKFVQYNVVGLSQAASPLTLNVNENKGRFGVRAATFAFFALFSTPAKCAKLRWSDNSRVAVVDMRAGENFGYGPDIDAATTDVIMSTYTKPAYAIKISTNPTCARTTSLRLNSGENEGYFLTSADGFSFVSCFVSPGIVVKLQNSGMTRVGAVTLAVNRPLGSVADWEYLYVVTGTDPASVVQLRMSDLTEVGVLQLQEGEGRLGALPGGNRSAGVAFFSLYKENQLGLSVKVQLDASGVVDPTMLRLSAASANAGETAFHAVCATADRVVYGTWTVTARLVAYHVGNNSRIVAVTLAAGFYLASGCIISADGATLIASMNSNPAKFVKHNIADLSQAATPLALNSGENFGRCGCRDSAFAYYALDTTLAKCAKLRWSDNSRVAVIVMSAGEDKGRGLDIDTVTSDVIMSTQSSPAYAVKITTSPTFARTLSLQLNSGENEGRFVTIADGFSFISCAVSPGRVVKVKNSDMTRVGAVTLSVNQPYGSVADWQFLCVVTQSDPASVVQVRLSDLTEASVLQLQEGSGRGAAMPGGNRSAGVAFFPMRKTDQLGLSVKVQLDASGAVCDSKCPTTTSTTESPPSTTTTSTTAAAATTTSSSSSSSSSSSTAAPNATTTAIANLDTSTTTTPNPDTSTTTAAPSTTNTATAPPNATNATSTTTDAPPPPAQPAPIPGTLTTDEQIATDASQNVIAGFASSAGASQAAMIASRAMSIPQVAACTGRNADGKRWLDATVSFPKSYFPPSVGIGASSGFHARGAMLSMFVVVLAALVLAIVAACVIYKSKFSLLAPMFISRVAMVAFGQVINQVGELAGMVMFAESDGGGADTALVVVPIIVVVLLALIAAVAIYRATINSNTRTLFYAPSVVEDIPPAGDDGGDAKHADGDDQQLLENRGSSSTVFAIVNGAFGRVCLTGTTTWYNPSNSAVFPLVRRTIGCDATLPDTNLEQKAKAKAADVKAASARSKSKNTSKQAEHTAMHAVQAERSQAAGAMIRGTLAPFSIVVIALAALFAGFCTGIAKAAPDSHCKSMLAVIAFINVFVFVFDFAVRPQIVPMRGYLTLFCNGSAALMSVLVAALLGTEEAARKKRGLVAFINFGSTAVVIVTMFSLLFIVMLRPVLLRVVKMQVVPTAAAMAAMPERAKELAVEEAEKAKGGRRAADAGADPSVPARKFRSAFEQELLTHSPRHGGDDDDNDDMLRRPSRGHRDRDRDRDGEHRRHHHRHSSRSHRRHRDDKHGDDDDEDRSRHHHRHRHHHHRERSKSRSGRDRHSSPRRRDEVADAAANEQRRSSKPSAEAERAASSSSPPRRERDHNRDADRRPSSPPHGVDAKRDVDRDRDRRHKSTSRNDDAAKQSTKPADAERSRGGESSHRGRHQSPRRDAKSQHPGDDDRKEQPPPALRTDREHRHQSSSHRDRPQSPRRESRCDEKPPQRRGASEQQPAALRTGREHRHELSRSEKQPSQHRHQSPRRDGAAPAAAAAAAAASTSASPRIASPQRVQQYTADQPATNHRHHRHRGER